MTAGIPQAIGRYEIKKELGRGGMATVYHAYDPRFQRDVAIKVLPREFLHDTTFRARFEREAQAIASLEHSAIVPVYDYGEEDGQPYLVMRYMSGGSLADRVRQGPLPLEEAASIVDRIAGALSSAHKRGVIHRDLKPANVLFDQYGEAYLGDFGIVKLTEATASLTGSHIVGTPSYIAPEMTQPGRLSPAVDTYALGVSLFEMLTGQVPYEGDTPLSILMAHLEKPIPDLRQRRPDLPPSTQSIIARAMAKDPTRRYPTPVDMAADLKAVVAGRQIDAAASTEPIEAPSAPADTYATSTPRPDTYVTSPRASEGIHYPTYPQATPPPFPAARPRRSSAMPWLLGGGVVIAGLCLIGGAIAAAFLLLPGVRGSGDAKPASPSGGVVATPYIPPTERPPVETPYQPPVEVPTEAPSTPMPTLEPVVGLGRIVYTAGSGDTAEIVIMDADGSNRRTLTSNSTYDAEPDLSPDGSQIVYESIQGGNRDIYVMSASGGNVRRLTTSSSEDRHPSWSPDGSLIVYESGVDSGAEIYVMDANGSGRSRMTNNSVGDRAPTFSPDGSMIAYMTEQRGKWEIAVMSYPSGSPIAIFDCPTTDCRFPNWSPDGSQIVYNTLTSSGAVGEVWVVDVASGRSSALVQGTGNGRPVWSGDGQYIFFNRTDSNKTNIYRLVLSTGQLERLSNGSNDYAPDWGP